MNEQVLILKLKIKLVLTKIETLRERLRKSRAIRGFDHRALLLDEIIKDLKELSKEESND